MLQIYKEYSGLEFNQYFNNKIKFYKFLNNHLMHYNHIYKKGLNVDSITFNPKGTCSEGGLYFCDESQCHLYCTNYGEKVAIVTIPNDARVYVEENKFKADKIFVVEIIDFVNMPDDFWINMLSKNDDVLKYIKQQYVKRPESFWTDKLVLCGLVLQFIENQTEEQCILAVKQNGMALQFVKNQSNEICVLAVQQNGMALRFVKNQTNEICILAVQQYGLALTFVDNQTNEICMLAIKQNNNAFYYVKYKNDDFCRYCVELYGDQFLMILDD